MSMQITLMDAYMIESLKNAGITKTEILKASKENRLEDFKEINGNFDYTLLYPLKDQLADILEKGYQIKFITKPGLMNLLKMKYNKEKGQDYKEEESALVNLRLTKAEADSVKGWLSPNWTIVRRDSTYAIQAAFKEQ